MLLRSFGYIALSVLVARCAGERQTGPGEPRFALFVQIVTSGDDIDPDGYTATIDGTITRDIPANGSATIGGLAAGSHTVALSGVASNCTILGEHPRTVVIQDGTGGTTRMNVSCSTFVGDLQVDMATSGEDLDPDGYMVTVTQISPSPPSATSAPDDRVDDDPTAFDANLRGRTGTAGARPIRPDATAAPAPAAAAAVSQAIDANGSVLFTDLPDGPHTVEITGIAGNCAVTGANPANADVPPGGTATLTFAVQCVPLTGGLSVTVATTGTDLDPDGYVVTLDGVQSQSVTTNGTAVFADLDDGTHSVELSGVAENCSVTSANPVSADVPPGGSGSATFAVQCIPRVGSLDVSTATTGTDPDPDGYTVVIDGSQSQTIGINGTVTITGVAEGNRSVELTGLAGNCSVSGANPVTVTVPYSGTASTSFAVACSDRLGDLSVTVTTTGSDQDPDGYSVTVDGTLTQTVATNGSVTFTGLAEGNHSVELTGLAGNCTVSGSNPQTASVPFAATGTATFTVNCAARTGTLDVTTATTGDDLDPDGYTITVDGTQSRSIGINATVTFTGLTEGDHAVQLTGVINNCTVTSANPDTVTVPFNGSAATSFSVTCSDRTGDLTVTTNTTGVDLDPNGYTVSVDGAQNQTIATNGSVTFTGLAEGLHTITLTGIAGNCTLSGINPRQANVPFQGTGTSTFDLTCTQRLGNLGVTTRTTGTDLDPDGYTVTVDGSVSQSVAINATTTFQGLTEGNHSVELTGLAGNCSVTSTNPVTANVPFNATATTSFDVNCVNRTGNLDVTTVSTGVDIDPDGYSVAVDGGTPQAILANGTVSFAGLDEGAHSVQLTGLEGNCTVTSTNPVTVTVPFSGTATTTFTVNCVERLGDLRIITTTSGTDLDPNGYAVTVDAGTPSAIGLADTLLFTGLDEASHTVELTGLDNNCTVSGSNPRTVSVPYAGTASTTFSITCAPLLGNLDVSVTTLGDSLDPDGYTVTVDGSQSQAIGINGTVTFVDLDDGNHSVQLSGARANCTVGGANPATATVPANGTGSHSWTVTCVPYEGTLNVVITTTGTDLDPDGYSVTVDGSTTQPSGTNQTVTFTNLAVGQHSIAISGRQDNCNVLGGNPQTATVAYNTTTSYAMEVRCLAFEQVMLGAGDIIGAAGDTTGASQTAAMLDQIGAAATIFTLGDHVPSGTAAQFNTLYHPTWGRHRDRTRPTIGNHEYDVNPQASPYWDYWDPDGDGLPAGARGQGYYAYNLGAWRVIVLNSEIAIGAGSAQLTWLQNELATTQKLCTLAYWHSPRYSSGPQTAPGDANLQAVWDALYSAGVELVLNGDGHFYERYARQNPSGVADPVFGIRQFIVGTGGSPLRTISPGQIQPNSQVRIDNTWGILKLQLHQNSYDWEFLGAPNASSSPLDSSFGETCHGAP